MPKTYTFRNSSPAGKEAAGYVDAVHDETNLTKTEIIARAVVLAKQVQLFEEARAVGDAPDVENARSSVEEKQGGGVHVGSVAQVEDEKSQAGADHSPATDDPSGGGNASAESDEEDDNGESGTSDPLESMLRQW